jgi:hypothetical protein
MLHTHAPDINDTDTDSLLQIRIHLGNQLIQIGVYPVQQGDNLSLRTAARGGVRCVCAVVLSLWYFAWLHRLLDVAYLRDLLVGIRFLHWGQSFICIRKHF